VQSLPGPLPFHSSPRTPRLDDMEHVIKALMPTVLGLLHSLFGLPFIFPDDLVSVSSVHLTLFFYFSCLRRVSPSFPIRAGVTPPFVEFYLLLCDELTTGNSLGPPCSPSRFFARGDISGVEVSYLSCRPTLKLLLLL